MEPITTQSPTTAVVDPIMREFDRSVAGEPPLYPNGTLFLRAELPDFGKTLYRHLREGTPIGVLYPDGREVLIEPADPRKRSKVGALLRSLAAKFDA